jgi:hypothetical protein
MVVCRSVEGVVAVGEGGVRGRGEHALVRRPTSAARARRAFVRGRRGSRRRASRRGAARRFAPCFRRDRRSAATFTPLYPATRSRAISRSRLESPSRGAAAAFSSASTRSTAQRAPPNTGSPSSLATWATEPNGRAGGVGRASPRARASRDCSAASTIAFRFGEISASQSTPRSRFAAQSTVPLSRSTTTSVLAPRWSARSADASRERSSYASCERL